MDCPDGKFQAPLERDFFRVMCGEYLGCGIDRHVWVSSLNPLFVVKVEDCAESFSNIIEWELWKEAQFADDARNWLAPCHSISPCGTVLIQERTTPAKRYPEKIPAWITDTKKANFGMIGRKFVCHDYACNLVADKGLTRRMKKADWWE